MIPDLRIRLWNKILKLQQLERAINSDDFQKLFNACSQEQKELIVEYIKTDNVDGVIAWLKSNSELTLKELRALAAAYGISYPNRYLKAELVQEIENARRNANRISGKSKSTESRR